MTRKSTPTQPKSSNTSRLPVSTDNQTPKRASLSGDLDGTPDEINATIDRTCQPIAAVIVQFERNDSHPDGEAQKTYGPFPWIQATYLSLRVGENGERELASWGAAGYWNTDDGETWSDFIISAALAPESKTWTAPNATAFLRMRDNDDHTVTAPCGCVLDPIGGTGAAFYMCERHEGAMRAFELLKVLADFWGADQCDTAIYPGAYLTEQDEPIRQVIRDFIYPTPR